MAKWGVLKQARQQKARMEKKGIFTSAAENFASALKVIDSRTDLNRKQKTALKERAAEAYLSSGYARVADIEERFDLLGGQFLKEAKDPKMQAEFLGMADDEKSVLLARHYIGSDAIQLVNDGVGDNPEAFYQILSAVVTEHWQNPEPDAVTSLITQMINARTEG